MSSISLAGLCDVVISACIESTVILCIYVDMTSVQHVFTQSSPLTALFQLLFDALNEYIACSNVTDSMFSLCLLHIMKISVDTCS